MIVSIRAAAMILFLNGRRMAGITNRVAQVHLIQA